MQVPSDLTVVMAVLKQERKERINVPVAASTFSDDVASIHGGAQHCLAVVRGGTMRKGVQDRHFSVFWLQQVTR